MLKGERCVLVNFICQFDWVKECPVSWESGFSPAPRCLWKGLASKSVSWVKTETDVLHKTQRWRQGKFCFGYDTLSLFSDIVVPGSQASGTPDLRLATSMLCGLSFGLQVAPLGLLALISDWIAPLALLVLLLADDMLWQFLASLLAQTNFYNKSPVTSISIS